MWIRDPFSVDTTEIPDDLTGAEQEKLLELSSDSTLVLELKKTLPLNFNFQRKDEYPALSH